MSGASAAGGVLSRLALPDAAQGSGGQTPNGQGAGNERAGDLDPDWLPELRKGALSWVSEHGFPTRKDENWRYTKLAPILDIPFELAGAKASSDDLRQLLQSSVLDLGGARLVFVNGYFRPELSELSSLPVGVTVSSLAAALVANPQTLEPILCRPHGEQHDAFTALNTAFSKDGAYIQLAAGSSSVEPIHLVFMSDTGNDSLVSNPHSVMLAEEGSHAVIVETHIGTAGDVHCTNAVTDVVLAKDARLEHYKVQSESETAFHLALLDVRQGAGSRFESHSMMLGARIARQEVRVSLQGDGAVVSLDGLYLPRGEQVHDNTVFIDHVAANCSSHQLYKGVLAGRGHGVFNGHIMVRPGADGTDANQKNKNLILSDKAEADTRPRLEIYADDVKCTHGAAVGQLDEEATLYLRSRGLSAQHAKQLLVYAFIHEMVDRIAVEPLRTQLRALLDDRSFDEQ